ncbi:MAG: ABC transporter ATP-binding protein [Stackebrandtia sp.]
MSPVIETEQLTRSFGSGPRKVTALSAVSLTVEHGEILALLGANGAGKTTLTKILATLLLPTSGTARVLGMDVARDERRIRAETSVIFGGDRGLYRQLTGYDNLRYFAVLNGVKRSGLRRKLRDALEQVGLAEVADRQVQTFSKGMKQRLHIAIGLINKSRILLLDEPTVGLDPVEARRLRDTIGALRADGSTILLTSHQLLDVEQLADRVAFLDQGAITCDLTLAEFVKQAGYAAMITVAGASPAPIAETFPSLMETVDLTEAGGSWVMRVRVKQWNPAVFGELSRALSGVRVDEVRVEEVGLEEAFAAVAGAAT